MHFQETTVTDRSTTKLTSAHLQLQHGHTKDVIRTDSR